MKVIRKIRDNFQSIADVRLFLRVASLVAWVRISLWFMTPIELLERMGTDFQATHVVPADRAAKFADFVNRFGGRRGPGKCLVRSLVLFRLLRGAGLPVEINFGLDKVKKPASGLDGHSWISQDGRPILESGDPDERFTVFYRCGLTRTNSR